LHPLSSNNFPKMDIKKLEKLENIKNFLENDDIGALNRYVEKIKPLIKSDEDFEEIFQELKDKNYDQALLVTEDIIFEMKGQSRDSDEDFEDVADFEEDDDFIYNGKEEDFGDIGMDDGSYFDDKDDDYF
jgi:hypothetical protein